MEFGLYLPGVVVNLLHLLSTPCGRWPQTALLMQGRLGPAVTVATDEFTLAYWADQV